MERKTIRRLVSALHLVFVGLLVFASTGPFRPPAEASSLQGEHTQNGSSPLFVPLGTAAMSGRPWVKEIVAATESSGQPPSGPAQTPPLSRAPEPAQDRALALPAASGATSPAPLNHPFDAPSQDLHLIANDTLEQDAYEVGSVGDGTRPTNYDFESGDLTGWGSVGTVSVKSGGSTGYYAELKASGRITSTAFTVPSDAQTFAFNALLSSTVDSTFYLYVLSGPSYGTSTQIFYVYSPQKAWTTYRFGAARWWGQSIKIVIRRYLGTVGVDNLGVSSVVAPQWDGTSILEQVSSGPTGKYLKMPSQGSIPGSGAIITSTAFTVPANGDRLKIDAIGSSGTYVGSVDAYILSGPTYGTSSYLGRLESTTWKTYSYDITGWKGQSIKLRLEKGLGDWVAVDNAGVVQNVIPEWLAEKQVVLATDGPTGNYAKLYSSGTGFAVITSTAFVIPAQAVVMSVDILSGGTGGNVYILSGADYGTSTWVVQNVQPAAWQRYTFDVRQWAGQSVKVKLKAMSTSGWAAFDNVGSNLVEEACGCYPSAKVGAPVDTSTGAESLGASDLFLPGRGVPIALSRSYNSMSTYSGTLGSRWMHSYEMTLTIGSDHALVRYSSGSVARFAKSGSTFTAPAGNFDTLVENGDGTYTLTTKRQVEYHFPSGGGALQRIEDRNGNATTLTYASGRLSTVGDPGGRSITFTYNLEGRISQVADPLGRSVSYGYSTAGDLITATNQAGNSVLYTYDSHRLVSATDNAGATLFYNYYDTANRVVTQTLGSAYTTTFAYNSPSAGQTTVTDPEGKAVTYFYDNRFRTTDGQDPYGNYISYQYNANNLPLTATDKLGFSTLAGYDAEGNLTTASDAIQGSAFFTYTALNDLSARSDPLGRTTSYGYDGSGNLTSATDALGRTTLYGRNALGQLTTITNALGYTTAFAYDAYGNLAAESNTLGQRVEYTYDGLSRRTGYKNADDRWTYYGYDLLGNLTAVTDTMGSVSRFEYDANSRRTASVDALQNRTAFGYDLLGRLITVTDPLTGTTIYAYDARGNTTSVRDPRGGTTSFEYDAVGRLITATNPLLQKTVYGYDANGNRTSVRDAESRLTTYDYDALGRLITTTDALYGKTIFGYDAVGNRTSVRDPEGRVTTFEYDALNRLVRATEPLSRITSYEYDTVGNRVVITDANSLVTRLGYDALGRNTVITDAKGYTTTFGYDSLGNRTAMTDTNGVATRYSYDSLTRLSGVTEALGQSTAYAYDAIGNRTTITDANLHVTTYSFDALSRVTSISRPVVGATTYRYDANGNLVGTSDPAGNVITNTYNAASQMTRAEYPERTVDYAYDRVGARTAVTETKSVQNWWNSGWSYRRPITISNGGAGELPVSYTVSLALSGATASDVYGKAQADGDDVRIVYGWEGYWEELPRDLPAFSADAITVTFATRTPIPAGSADASYYLYYGNASAGAATAWGQQASTGPTLTLGPEQGKPSTSVATTATTYQYDSLSRPSTATFPGSLAVGYAYDRSGLRTRLTLPDGKLITSTYDAAGRLENVIDWQSRTTTYAYDAGNRVTGITLPNSTSASNSYDELNRTTYITNTSSVSGTLSALSYTYDKAGNRTAVTESIAGSGQGPTDHQFAYDSLYRLTEARTAAYTLTYQYDPTGNRTVLTDTGQILNYTYDAAGA